MSTYDNAPPLPDWVCEPRPCPLPDISREHAARILARGRPSELRMPPLAMPDCELGEN